MVRMDWDRILSTKAEALTDDEIEDLFPMVIRCDIDDVENIHNLRALMKLSQEMLQHKDNQVESLLLECDELKEKLSSALSASDKSQRKTSQVIAPDDIERDNSDTKQTEFAVPDNYQDTIKMKNDKIKTLMQELEGLEKENEILKSKLEILKDEMEDATENMDGMTEELDELRSKNIFYKEKIDEVQQENSALLSRIEELGAEQAERDKAIDDFGEAIDLRIAEWKNLLDERDAEISRLREDLSHALTHSVRTVREQSKSQMVQLNEEIHERDRIITDLQSKLLEATDEINESATLIEKLKTDAKKLAKTGRRKEHRDLLKKVQEANERISTLQESLNQAEEAATLKSEQLCEALGTLRRFESKDQGLAETISEVKELREQLRSKGRHVQDLINVVNNLEALNSTREMQILALKEKLGMPEDEEIAIEGVVLKSQEEARKRNELIQKNEALLQDNLDMQSDIRVLRYKLSKLGEKVGTSGDTIDAAEASGKFGFHYQGINEDEIATLKLRAELDETRENIQIVIEENEALRKGMHEILDSIHDQDGKSTVEVHSRTLEKLLEALDVRHVAGWYHPAMRLQERLNVIQGSNAELRSQVKIMRSDLEKKDELLRKYSTKGNATRDKYSSDESENEQTKMYVSEIQRIQDSYRDELENWQKEKATLDQENQELRDTVEKLSAQFEVMEKDVRVIESGEDEARAAFATKSRETAESVVQIIVANRKCATLESLLNAESAKSYGIHKEAIELESSLRKSLAEMDRRNKTLENEIGSLQSNLSNSVSLIEFNELKEKFEESNVRLRAAYELQLATREIEETSAANDSVESVEKSSPMNLEALHEISQKKLAKCEANLRQVDEMNSELRQQLVDLQKELARQIRPQKLMDEERWKTSEEYEQRIATLTIENENLSRSLEISREEAQMYHTTNSLRTFELDNLRHQILDLHSVSEDKETIARLGFELTSCKATEIESSKRKAQLENEVSHLREDLSSANKKLDEARAQLQDCRKICANRCSSYEDVIDFLRCQYAGSTSVTALERFHSMLKNLVDSRAKIAGKVKEANQLNESAKSQQEMLTNRLAIVERLKDILEQQIGSPNVENMMQNFSENSQYTLNEIRLKRRITQLDNELRIVNAKLSDYESTILSMEYEMLNVQRIFRGKPDDATLSVSEPRIETDVAKAVDRKSVFTQARVESQSVEVQSEAYDFGAKIRAKELPEVKKMKTTAAESPVKEIKAAAADSPVKEIKAAAADSPVKEIKDAATDSPVKEIKNAVTDSPVKEIKDAAADSLVKEIKESAADSPVKEIKAAATGVEAISVLKDQLDQALVLASERSAIVIKYEAQIAECQAKVTVLERAIIEKDSQLKLLVESKSQLKKQPEALDENFEGGDKAALKSTINTLQKMITQKEETVARYQNLLKDDRDEHSKAAARFQEEIRGLREEILRLQEDAERRRETAEPSSPKIVAKPLDEPTKEPRPDIEAEEKIARFGERVSTLEAELHIAKELGERWHRLAEERFQHMDHMRARLEEQHKNELESYRLELNKWQNEADMLRQQLSENRMLLAKGNISMAKELQERDNKIQELTVACQQLQSEFEMMETMTMSQPVVVHGNCATKMQEMAQALGRDQASHFQSELDLLRRQMKSQGEKEKMYRDQIADLKQQLSRKYMAAKSEERRISNREMQLERKLKTLEEELHKARIQLDREYRVQEAKRVKTAEELSLWEKQKKWQRIAEKLKKELKVKIDEYNKLSASYEKMRAVVSCMEREKWYLRSKLRSEGGGSVGGFAGPTNELQLKIVENLQIECQTLRDRVKELTDRLESEDNHELLQKLEQQRRRVAALEAVTEGNTFVIDQLEKLEAAKATLEKTNLCLESENFELRMEMEKINLDTPRLREKVQHLEKYVELLKVEKSSESSPRLSDKDLPEPKKSVVELEKTVFILKRVVEKLQAENRRLRQGSATGPRIVNTSRTINIDNGSPTKRQYEEAQKRVVALEADLQLAEQRIVMLENARKEDDNAGEVGVLRQQLAHKSELLDKVKQLLTRAAINEKALRQRIHQIEMKQTLSTIPESSLTPSP